MPDETTLEHSPLWYSGYDAMRHGRHGYRKERRYIGPDYKNLLEYWNLSEHATILDIASGKGEAADMLKQLYKARVIQTDLARTPLLMQRAWWRKLLRRTKPTAVAEAKFQPFAPESFDAIHVKDLLVHIDSKIAFFAETARLLKPMGKLLIVTQPVLSSFMAIHYGNPEPKKPDSETISIVDFADYAQRVSEIQRLNGLLHGQLIEEISPPYFRTVHRDVIRAAETADMYLDVTSQMPTVWQPPKGADWHGGLRMVLSFVKEPAGATYYGHS